MVMADFFTCFKTIKHLGLKIGTKRPHHPHIQPVQAHSLLLVAVLWYDPSAQTQTLHHLDPPVSKKKTHPVYTQWQLRNRHHYSAASYSQRLCEATHINASLPPSSSPSTTTRPPRQLKTFPRPFCWKRSPSVLSNQYRIVPNET